MEAEAGLGIRHAMFDDFTCKFSKKEQNEGTWVESSC